MTEQQFFGPRDCFFDDSQKLYLLHHDVSLRHVMCRFRRSQMPLEKQAVQAVQQKAVLIPSSYVWNLSKFIKNWASGKYI